MSLALSVVSENGAPIVDLPRDVLADRIKRLQAETKHLACEHVHALEDALVRLEQMAAEIASGGEVYPVGVREIARRLADDCAVNVHVLEAIGSRT